MGYAQSWRHSVARSWWGAMGMLALLGVGPAAQAASVPDVVNLRVVGHTDINGAGKGGEGLALKQYGARTVLFLAHESGPQCFSVIDVTVPAKPVVLKQVPVEADFVRCNSLGLSGNVLVVARQSVNVGQPHGGIKTYDVSDASNPQLLSYMDLTGPASRGTHYLSFSDGRYAYLATGARDFVPKNPLDDQMLMIVDMQDPRAPKEVGRWWLPGTKVGDEARRHCGSSVSTRGSGYTTCWFLPNGPTAPTWAGSMAASSCSTLPTSRSRRKSRAFHGSR